MSVGSAQIRVVLIALLLGSATTPILKGIYETTALNAQGVSKFFEKPLFLTFIMFVGMALVLPVHFYMAKNVQANEDEPVQQNEPSEPVPPSERAPLLPQTTPGSDKTPPILAKVLNKSGSSASLDPNDPFGDNVSTSTRGSAKKPQQQSPAVAESNSNSSSASDIPDFSKFSTLLDWKLNLTLLIPTSLDLLGSALSTIGLLYTTMSVYQLFRCTVIIVTALLKRFVLKHRLTNYMWVGVGLNMIAMMLVAMTAILDSSAADGESLTKPGIPHGNATIGLIFILASCLVQGAQYVVEEKVMAFDSIPPLIVVGMEGFWGVVLSFLVVFPIAALLPGSDNGMYEDIPEAWTMVKDRDLLKVLLFMFVVLVSFYNVACIYVTYVANSIWHAIMDNCRPAAVWLIGLTLYYTTGLVGEPWRMTSFLELAGIIVLFYGTAVYSGHAKFPGLRPDELEEEIALGEVEQPVLRDSFRDPMPATPRFSARGSPHIGHAEAPLSATSSISQVLQTMTQSPRLGPMHPPHGHSHSHGGHPHGHGHSHAPGASSHAYGSL